MTPTVTERPSIPGPARMGLVALVLYVAVCFGLIARRNGRNPFLYGLLSVISPFNLVALGIWAFRPSRDGGDPR